MITNTQEKPSHCKDLLKRIITESSLGVNPVDYSALALLMEDPYMLQRLPFIPPEHPLLAESQIAGDAFEAVTNGMHNPGVLENLKSLGKDSPFYPFKLLTLAIHSFYQGEGEKALHFFEEMPRESPPYRLFRVFKILILKDGTPGNREEEQLVKEIQKEKAFLEDLWDQVAEAEESEPELLFNTLALVMDCLKNRSLPAAFGLYVHCLERIICKEDYPLSDYLNLGKTLFGHSQTYRIWALLFLEREIETSILFWLFYGQSRIKDKTLSLEEAKVILFLCNDLYESLLRLETEPSDEYLASLGERISEFLSCLSPLINGNRRFQDLISSLSIISMERTFPRNQERYKESEILVGTNRFESKRSTTIQLELF